MNNIIRFSFIFCSLFFLGCDSKKPPPKPKRVVYVDMVADLIHPGHIAFLKKAKTMGDYLIVGLITDEDAESYSKRRPYLNVSERSEMLRACRYVDEVISGSPYRLSDEFLDAYHIDIVVHGDDYSMEALYYYYQPAIDRGILRVVEYTPDVSTSDLVERVFRLDKLEKKEPKIKKKEPRTGSFSSSNDIK